MHKFDRLVYQFATLLTNFDSLIAHNANEPIIFLVSRPSQEYFFLLKEKPFW